jgi:hypothetical protein
MSDHACGIIPAPNSSKDGRSKNRFASCIPGAFSAERVESHGRASACEPAVAAEGMGNPGISRERSAGLTDAPDLLRHQAALAEPNVRCGAYRD